MLSTTTTKPLDRIRAFWDDRARQFGTEGRATLRETHLREVEVRTMMRRIARRRPARVLDVGCGNGWSTRQYARAFPRTQFIGVDFSCEMIRFARQEPLANCSFFEGNVLDASTIPTGPFDLVITQRCLQNLPDWSRQRRAIENLLLVKSDRGQLLLMECSKDGVEQLNRVRTEFGMDPMEGIEPWHNCFVRDRCMIEEFGAAVEYFASTYMFAAKVIHKKLSYIARYLPPVGNFGYDRLYVIG